MALGTPGTLPECQSETSFDKGDDVMKTYYARNYIGALRKEGKFEKWGTGHFFDGNKEYGRTLYNDKKNK